MLIRTSIVTKFNSNLLNIIYTILMSDLKGIPTFPSIINSFSIYERLSEPNQLFSLTFHTLSTKKLTMHFDIHTYSDLKGSYKKEDFCKQLLTFGFSKGNINEWDKDISYFWR